MSVLCAAVSNEQTALRVLVPNFTGVRVFVQNCVDRSTRVAGELSTAHHTIPQYSGVRKAC